MTSKTFKEDHTFTTGFVFRTLTLVLFFSTFALAKSFISYEKAIQVPKAEQYLVNIKNITLYNYLDLISKLSHRVIVLECDLPELTVKENPKDAVTLKELVSIANVYLSQTGLKILLKEDIYYVRNLKQNAPYNKRTSFIYPVNTTDNMQLYHNGTTVGLQVTSVIQGGTYMQMGFRQHDIIMGINKKRFEHISQIEQAFAKTFQNDQAFCLDVLRDDATIELCY